MAKETSTRALAASSHSSFSLNINTCCYPKSLLLSPSPIIAVCLLRIQPVVIPFGLLLVVFALLPCSLSFSLVAFDSS
jgi:hypothetical protein